MFPVMALQQLKMHAVDVLANHGSISDSAMMILKAGTNGLLYTSLHLYRKILFIFWNNNDCADHVYTIEIQEKLHLQ